MQLSNLTPLLENAQSHGYGVGSFSARSTLLVDAILQAAENTRSPVIVQMSANEFGWFGVTAAQFAQRFHQLAGRYSIPAALHLDHTKEIEIIRDAIEAGFTSVMIDASHQSFENNIALSRAVVEMAHAKGVSVEAELGMIGGADKLETGSDTELYTDPAEAAEFVQRTGVDALAVSVGTAHGVYAVKNPTIDFARLAQLRQAVKAPLVLHGGSGLPPETVQRAIALDGLGGVSKINIATDLELAFLAAIGRSERMSNAEIEALPQSQKDIGSDAVRAVVENRMREYVFSAGHA